LMLVWFSAARLPKVMVTMDRMATTTSQSALMASMPIRKNLNMATKPIFLEPAASMAVMVVGAPSYTSGAQEWNGTMATLKPKPTMTMTNASQSISL